MRGAAILAPVFVLALTTGAAQADMADHHPVSGFPPILLAFTSMYGVDGPFIGDANKVRDVEGDELPWEIGPVTAKLDVKGNLTLVVRRLVFKDVPEVPPELRGKNDEEAFRALVSCLTEDGDQVVTRNVVTQGFPATPSGNSFIHAHLNLPNPCVAPIVMVLAGSEDKWFAMTGFEKETDESAHR
jgi:hypothetical protein